MKGDTCGFLHEFNAERMPVCRSLLKYGVCKEPDCPYKHSLTDIKVCQLLLAFGAQTMHVNMAVPYLFPFGTASESCNDGNLSKYAQAFKGCYADGRSATCSSWAFVYMAPSVGIDIHGLQAHRLTHPQ